MPAAAAPKLSIISVSDIHESPWNPRKHFGKKSLEELAESLKSSVGQINAVLVRPRPEGGYELAAGHRRLRAARLANLIALEAKVRDMDDETFIKVLNVENLQREDVHPLDEARGYELLMKKLEGYTVSRIAKEAGKSESYVYDRLQLLKLISEAQELFLADRIEFGHAVILARLGPEWQRKIVLPSGRQNFYSRTRATGLWEAVSDSGELFADEEKDKADKFRGLKPVTPRELQLWVNDHVRFEIEKESAAPQLFPETVALVKEAEESREKVIAITFDHQVPHAARDEKEKTYGVNAWKHADGKKGKVCDRSVVGLVKAGPSRGEAFRVCVAKDRCKTHWAANVKKREQREQQRATTVKRAAAGDTKAKKTLDAETARENREAEKHRQAREKWDAVTRRAKKKIKELQAWFSADVQKRPIAEVIAALLENTEFFPRKGGRSAYPVTSTSSAEDVLRAMFYFTVEDIIPRHAWADVRSHNVEDLKRDTGLDFLKILDEVDPPAAPELKAKPEAPKPKKTAAQKASGKKRGRALVSFMVPVQPDAVLAAIVGERPLVRTELTKKLWAYIEKNGLQDKKNRRMINADEKLKAVFGGKAQLNMFAMTAAIGKHCKPAKAA